MDELNDTQHAQTDPDTERIERACVRVVTLARLIRCLVQVHHYRQAGQEEQQERQRKVLPTFRLALFVAFAALPYYSDDTQNQRQEVIHIVSLILLQFRRQQILVAQHRIVDKRNTADPVTFGNVAVRLNIILSSREIPHEIAPVHEVHLITEEETHILRKSRTILRFLLTAVVIADAFALHFCPFFIRLNMRTLR